MKKLWVELDETFSWQPSIVKPIPKLLKLFPFSYVQISGKLGGRLKKALKEMDRIQDQIGEVARAARGREVME